MRPATRSTPRIRGVVVVREARNLRVVDYGRKPAGKDDVIEKRSRVDIFPIQNPAIDRVVVDVDVVFCAIAVRIGGSIVQG